MRKHCLKSNETFFTTLRISVVIYSNIKFGKRHVILEMLQLGTNPCQPEHDIKTLQNDTLKLILESMQADVEICSPI